jgi:hypothetical protein
MLASAKAIELEEDLASVEASITDLITAEEAEDMAGMGRTRDFGPSLMTKDMIEALEKEGYFGVGQAKPLQDEMVPKPQAADAIVFRDVFAYGLCFPVAWFLCHVLEAFEVQLHHLTPNGILTLSKFCWACLSYGAEPHIGTFCEYYELQRQPKKVGKD